ncbi:23S rRNA (guanine(745)-N(1))-methyltransferase [Thalassotalea maritima]|uniref:23S rRNA (guanine(745)-N(1))-methyltransferase n=1 Tax=Thalassotalea maritima TaxID=3242416 RepID=UPI0035276DBE
MTDVTQPSFTAPNYLCPICQSALEQHDKQYVCENRHSFDIAKQGYVNLLPVQFKHSLNPGDNKDMVMARRAFLSANFYQPLRDSIVALQQKYKPNGCIVDAGCGEGYYTHAHKSATTQVYGVDIAKEAIKLAARSYKTCHFSVASIAQLPFANGYADWLYSVYAPIKAVEFHRLLADDGYLLTVTPGAKHLWELKQLIYQDPREHNQENHHIEGFTLCDEQHLRYEMAFNHGEQALTLLAMTPFAFKSSEQLVESLSKVSNFRCQADFTIRLYQKTP